MEPKIPPLPPARKTAASSDSFPAVAPNQEDRIWKMLRGIHEQLETFSLERGRDLVRFNDLQETVDEHGQDIRELRESMTVYRELRVEIKDLRGELRDIRRADRQQDQALAQQDKLITKQDGEIDELANAKRAGGAAGRKWATLISILGMILGTAVATGVQECQKDAVYPAKHPGQ